MQFSEVYYSGLGDYTCKLRSRVDTIFFFFSALGDDFGDFFSNISDESKINFVELLIFQKKLFKGNV